MKKKKHISVNLVVWSMLRYVFVVAVMRLCVVNHQLQSHNLSNSQWHH